MAGAEFNCSHPTSVVIVKIIHVSSGVGVIGDLYTN